MDRISIVRYDWQYESSTATVIGVVGARAGCQCQLCMRWSRFERSFNGSMERRYVRLVMET